MKLLIGKYVEIYNCHVCTDEEGRERFIDVLVDGGIGHAISNADLTGRIVECEYVYPHVEIAMNVRFVDDKATEIPV